MGTEEVHYCTACMTKSVLTIGDGQCCPSCGMHNFMLYRAGQIGTAMHFDRAGIAEGDFSWAVGHEEIDRKCREAVRHACISRASDEGNAQRLRDSIQGSAR